MSFLGAVSSLNGTLVRPHDIVVSRVPGAAADGIVEVRAIVERVVALGFEVRVELIDAATKKPLIAQITRDEAEALALAAGETVYLRASKVPPLSGIASGVSAPA